MLIRRGEKQEIEYEKLKGNEDKRNVPFANTFSAWSFYLPAIQKRQRNCRKATGTANITC
jgi:hypothetical protein